MKNWKNRIIYFLLVVVVSVGGCSSTTDIVEDNTGDLMSLVNGASRPTAQKSIDSRFRQALHDFSWNLFQKSIQKDGNVLISPASVYLALGMAYNGADSDTLQAMKETLEAADLSEEEFNTFCRDYSAILGLTGEKTQLSIANAIWYRQGFNPHMDFLQKNADYFNAAAHTLDFSSPAALETINGWVKKETRDTIDKIIDQIDPDVVMYLMNAVYFKSDWETPFDAANTYEHPFEGTNGPVAAAFMYRIGHMDYIDTDGVQGIILPYEDARFQFIALLPGDGTDVRTLINGLNSETVNRYLQTVENGLVGLSLPKFETSYEASLKKDLTGMGMGAAFDPSQADFSRMNATQERNLYISEIRHKTFCRVDELGTEASAVTSIEMRVTSMLMPDILISFDQPFVYGIIDTITGAPLFLGLMENPAE